MNLVYKIKTIETEEELVQVLDMCYKILGEDLRDAENYTYEDWKNRLEDLSKLLLFATIDGVIASAVLGRAENQESLIIGFTACEKEYRNQGITKALIEQIEYNARVMGYKYITLGSDADTFYEKCGYNCITEIQGQKIYQKLL